ncbi:MAG TPA: class I SAM-dependent methyltransferase [Thiolapillus brandeum]|uniref:Class I SAM-dependent methyltransferase n=1 Tax=Thiolapillus brandeum TaxID=1076588 RepID=A0A831K436_9GAMM|nr:class I SAM-dependent methyltransferase [Thiolapillus brandeum]
MAERLNAQQWAAYWQNHTITSFHGAFAHNYDGPIKAFWQEVFSRLPENSSILDLGTGNGALALLAVEYAHTHDSHFQVTGIDFADIQPSQLEDKNPLLREIRFIGNTPMENTALEPASQDLIMSQFGFEYGDMQASLKEVKRLLKPENGCFIAMIHHQDSAVLKQAREALQQIRRCENSGLTEKAERLVMLQQILAKNGHLTAAQQQQAQQLHQSFTQGIDKLNRYARQLKDPSHVQIFTRNLMTLFNRHNAARISPEQRLKAIALLRNENENYRQRMKDLRTAAYSEQDFTALQQALKKNGWQIKSTARQQYNGQHFCNHVVACAGKA